MRVQTKEAEVIVLCSVQDIHALSWYQVQIGTEVSYCHDGDLQLSGHWLEDQSGKSGILNIFFFLLT